MIARRQFNGNEPSGPAGVPRKRRFDGEAFYAALDGVRRDRRCTWKQVALESGVSASTLTRMAQGRRPDVDSLAALVDWAGLSADTFLLDEGVRRQPGALAMISIHLRNDPQLTPEAADAIDEMVKATYERMTRRR